MTKARDGIYLLASYPKSGNTWVRIMLESWYADGQAVDINKLGRTLGIMTQELFETVLDLSPGDLTLEETNRARPALARLLAREIDKVEWYKTHDANLPAPGAAEPPFPAETLRGVVLIVRDPRDVAPSLANHSGSSIDDVITQMANVDRMIARMGAGAQVPQLVSSWSRFQESWLDADVPLLPVRYEDLSKDPANCLRAILDFAGLAGENDRIQRTVDSTRFEILQRQEREQGFREYSPKAREAFFRLGRAGGWRESLTSAQVERLERDHGAVMTRLGYRV